MYYCTLFNSDYLAKGILTIQSLLKVCPDATLYVLAMDDRTESKLNSLGLQQLVTINLSQFETPELLAVKKTRTLTEYCWTCGSVFCHYCMTSFSLSHCIYIDADLYFFSSPELLLMEARHFDVMITLHHYSDGFDQSGTSGKYCVQFVYFKNSDNGMEALNWWKNACLEWCYNRVEDGKFGDQKYLDDWPERFQGVHVMEHEGGGVAPWNVQQYWVTNDQELILRNKKTGKVSPLVFYHFHHLNNYRIRRANEFRLGPYPISNDVMSLIYKPYIKDLISLYKEYVSDGFDPLGSKVIKISYVRFLFHKIKASFIPKDKFLWRV